MVTSIFIVGTWSGFDFNNDKRWAPGRALKGGPNGYLKFKDGMRIEIKNMWACVIDTAGCMNISSRLKGLVNYIEAINLVHLHELCHACDDGIGERYDKKQYSHTYYWNKTLIPLSKIDESNHVRRLINDLYSFLAAVTKGENK